MRCRNCHSSFDDLDTLEILLDDEPRCPKCGTPFKPRDIETVDPFGINAFLASRNGWMYLWLIAFGLALLIMWIAVVRVVY